ncbi:MAG: asparagine--tRNA ligase [archaeon]
MTVLTIKQAMEKGDGQVAIRGWVYRERGSKNVRFLIIRDSSGIVQCVIGKENPHFAEAETLQVEASVEVEGTIKKDDRAPSGYEVQVTTLKVVGLSDTFPISRDQSPELLLDNRHLWLRSRKLTSVMKIRHTVLGAIHEFFRGRGFYEFTPPIFTPNACEGSMTLFKVKYFDQELYLTQSWQLYAEAGIFALERIYDVSPTFRAEKSKTSRHLAEFWMAEMEAAWMTLEDVVQIAKEEIAFIIKKVLAENAEELKILERDADKLKAIVEKPFPTITYTEALKVLKEKAGMDVPWGKDLRTVEEEKLMEHFDTPVAVVEYPKDAMAFYKMEKKIRPGVEKDDAPGPVALCFDILVPEGYGEIVGGSQRDTDIEALRKGLEKEGENIDNYAWYLDLRKYGSVPHAGYGLGVERVITWICGLDNIKDTIPFPRTMRRMTP